MESKEKQPINFQVNYNVTKTGKLDLFTETLLPV